MSRQPHYLVTTRVADLPVGHQLFMVDGTVPSWRPEPGDQHWDHHRPGGRRIQVDEMPAIPEGAPLLDSLGTEAPASIVTTQLDADACVAAAWLQLTEGSLGAHSDDVVRRLRAIAFDCDHLGVPPELEDLADFAANAVAAMKTADDGESGRASDGSSSARFRRSTESLIAAAQGAAPWPGEHGEAVAYWQRLLEVEERLIAQRCVSPCQGGHVVDGRWFEGYIDPRAANRAVVRMQDLKQDRASSGRHAMAAVVLGVRNFPKSTGAEAGLAYTLGSNPRSAVHARLNYLAAGVWPALTRLEVVRRGGDPGRVDTLWGDPSLPGKIGLDPWGGRDVVGGSGWNTPSALLPHEVMATVRRCLGG